MFKSQEDKLFASEREKYFVRLKEEIDKDINERINSGNVIHKWLFDILPEKRKSLIGQNQYINEMLTYPEWFDNFMQYHTDPIEKFLSALPKLKEKHRQKIFEEKKYIKTNPNGIKWYVDKLAFIDASNEEIINFLAQFSATQMASDYAANLSNSDKNSSNEFQTLSAPTIAAFCWLVDKSEIRKKGRSAAEHCRWCMKTYHLGEYRERIGSSYPSKKSTRIAETNKTEVIYKILPHIPLDDAEKIKRIL